MANEWLTLLPLAAGLAGAGVASLSAPVATHFKSDQTGLKQRLFMIGSDLPARWRRGLGTIALAGFLTSAAALAYAATPGAPVRAAIAPSPAPAKRAGQPAAPKASPQAPPAKTSAPAAPAVQVASLEVPRPIEAPRPALDTSHALDGGAIDYYYNRAIADNPALRGARVGLTADESRRLTALEVVEADYWATQPAWSRRSFASYDDAVGVLGKANVDDLQALQKKWRSGRIETDLDQLSSLSPQDRQAEIDRRGASLNAKLSQRAGLASGSPQYATLSRDIADAQANLADIQGRYGIAPRQP